MGTSSCKSCGVQKHEKEELKKEKLKKDFECSECGKVNIAGYQFCKGCGAKAGTTSNFNLRGTGTGAGNGFSFGGYGGDDVAETTGADFCFGGGGGGFGGGGFGGGGGAGAGAGRFDPRGTGRGGGRGFSFDGGDDVVETTHEDVGFGGGGGGFGGGGAGAGAGKFDPRGTGRGGGRGFSFDGGDDDVGFGGGGGGFGVEAGSGGGAANPRVGELGAKLVAAKKAVEDFKKQVSALNQELKENDIEIERRKQAEIALEKELREKNAEIARRKRSESILEKELKEKDAEIERSKQAKFALEKELSNMKSRQDALRLALEEENQRALSNLRLSLEADLAASKKLSHDAAKALDAEMEKHKAIEADLKKRLAEAEQAKPPVQHAISAVRDEELAQYKAKVKQLQLQLAGEVRRNARKVDEVQDGELIVDKSVILGKGATAVVYRGTFKGRECAVKVFNERSVEVGRVLEREVHLMANTRHANLLDVLAACTDRTKELLVVMELMEGGSLSVRIGSKPKLTRAEQVAIALGTARGLSHLHRVGVIHRDVKPQNVLLQKDDTAKLADFGLACTMQTITSSTMTGSGGGGGEAGTPAYMSPELWEDGDRGRESDVYAFGITVWELMQGMQPWLGQTSAFIRSKVRGGARPEPVVKDPQRVGLLVAQSVLQDKRMRPTMDECVEQLEWCQLAMSEQKALLKREAVRECEMLRTELYSGEDADDTKTANLYARAREAALTLVKMGGEASIKCLVLGNVTVERKMDIATAAECMGRMRAGPLDKEAIAILFKKVGAEQAGQIENLWLDMDKRGVRTPGTVLLLGEDGEQEATTAELIEMVRDVD